MKNQQVEIISKALDLSCKIRDKTNSLKALESETFKSAPPEPKRKYAPRKGYPPINHQTHQTKFDWKKAFTPTIIIFIALCIIHLFDNVISNFKLLRTIFIPLVWILPILMVGYPIYYYLFVHKKNIDNETEKIKNSSEYIEQCSLIDAENEKNQKELDKAYAEEKKKYQEIILPAYKQELQIWTDEHNKKITLLQNDLDKLKLELANLYNTTKILTLPYQNIQALEYIHNVISTSDNDVKKAIEMYDRRNEQIN